MSNLSEEEIIKECIELYENNHHELGDCWDEEYSSNAIKGLLDLYNKEKEKNKELLEEYHKRVSTIIKYEQTIKEAVDEFENVLEK